MTALESIEAAKKDITRIIQQQEPRISQRFWVAQRTEATPWLIVSHWYTSQEDQSEEMVKLIDLMVALSLCQEHLTPCLATKKTTPPDLRLAKVRPSH